MHRRLLVAVLCAPVLLSPIAASAQPIAGPTVFAAASLTDVMHVLADEWKAAGHPAPLLSFAASSTLARQLEQGAPAGIFASADEPWMDYVQQRHLIVDATRVSTLTNALVLIAPADRAKPIRLDRDTDLAALLGTDGRIATGDPFSVPVGKYAQAALTWMGQWDKLSPRLARADNVRSALLLVERGEAPLGIVYATDAAASPGVRVVGIFPAESHPPVTYPFALTRHGEADPEAKGFLAFITGGTSAATYRRFGFGLRAP
jgi:molybdate transport system substrate-binding protein